MPITKSAKKALKQSKKRWGRNIKRSRLLKNELKELRKLTLAKDKKGAQALISKIYQVLDKASKTNIIRKNTASRMKSRLTKAVNKL